MAPDFIHKSNKETGNILFLILLAVVLFAALSYAVTSSMRGGGKDASGEKASTQAAAIIQYGGLVENTVKRTMLVNDIKEYGLDFDDGTGPSTATANSTCTATACRIFTQSSRDGVLAPQQFPEAGAVDPRWRVLFPSHGGGNGTATTFFILQVINIGTSQPDVVMMIPGLRPDVCKAINDLLWSDVTYSNESYAAADSYSGALTSLPSVPASGAIFGDESAYFKGKQAGCVGRENLTNPNGPYGGNFYQVLIER